LNKEFFELPVERPGYYHVWQMYTMKVRKLDRTKFLAKLREQGIGASVHFDPAVHQQPYWAELGFNKLKFPVTDQITATICTLPIYPQMSESDVAFVAETCNRVAPQCVS
jgi:perosamine synthetase